MPNLGGNMSLRRTTCLKPGSNRGFTLVELMIAVAVIGILAIVAVPSMTALINNSRTTGQTEELVGALQLARAEAIRRNARVTICPGTGTTCSGSTSWDSWTMFGRDNTSADTDVIRGTTVATGMTVTSSVDRFVYKPSGMIDGQQKLEVAKSGDKRCITVLISGVVSVAKGGC